LANLFWGDQNLDRARSCLRTALCRLRRTLESEGIPAETCLLTTPTGEIGFNQESEHWLDVAAFEELAGQVLAQPVHAIEAADAQKLERALRLHTGELLEGFYDDWVLWERERLQRLYLNGLAHPVQQYETCRKILAAELNIQPMGETQALHTRAILEAPQHHHRQPQPINLGESPCIQQALQQICVGIQVLQKAQEQLLRAIDLTG
jgi:DNA-binding SARP family transcriptional activator